MIFFVDPGQTRTVTYRDYRQLDLNAALDRCMTLPLSDFYLTLDPNEKLSILNDFMTGLFDEFVPSKTRRCFDSDTPWFDAPVGRAVLERDIAYIFWKANRNQHTWEHFKLCNRATNTIKYSKRRFMMSH
jgi:hypothetical protein